MDHADRMTCQELVELVTDYLEGALPAEQRARFEAHLLACPGCEEYVQQVRLTIDATGRLTEESLDPRTRDSLLSIFRDWKRLGGQLG
jgi:anti-sigma factor RsiW